MNTISLRIYMIRHFQSTKFYEECIEFCMFDVHNFLENVEYYVHWMNTITRRVCKILFTWSTQFFKEQSKFCMFDVQSLSENVDYSAHWTNTITQRIYIISFILSMLFFEEYSKFCTFNVKECRIFYALNKHYYSWNLYNFVHSKYAIFWRTLNVSHIRHTQFLNDV